MTAAIGKRMSTKKAMMTGSAEKISASCAGRRATRTPRMSTITKMTLIPMRVDLLAAAGWPRPKSWPKTKNKCQKGGNVEMLDLKIVVLPPCNRNICNVCVRTFPSFTLTAYAIDPAKVIQIQSTRYEVLKAPSSSEPRVSATMPMTATRQKSEASACPKRAEIQIDDLSPCHKIQTTTQKSAFEQRRKKGDNAPGRLGTTSSETYTS